MFDPKTSQNPTSAQTQLRADQSTSLFTYNPTTTNRGLHPNVSAATPWSNDVNMNMIDESQRSHFNAVPSSSLRASDFANGIPSNPKAAFSGAQLFKDSARSVVSDTQKFNRAGDVKMIADANQSLINSALTNEATLRRSVDVQMQLTGLPKVGAMPNMKPTKDRPNPEYDYSKNYKDPESERPGEYKCIDWDKVNETMKKDGAAGSGLGSLQTPIDLSTKIDIKEDFQDNAFKFGYDWIQPASQTIYKQKAQQFQIAMDPESNFFQTKTVSLFDKHLERANLYGLQTHFHAPSEHSIDGKLMDLEMHIVHALDPNWKEDGDESAKSQFTNGVLGFLFKAVEDDYFTKNKIDDYHDRFLKDLLADQLKKEEPKRKRKRDMFLNLLAKLVGSEKSFGPKPKESLEEKKLNMTKFVRLLNYDRRWTYNGSLTTIPFAEGILWNVIEQVIPIRQSTLELYLDYRKAEEEIIVDKYESEADKKANLEKLNSYNLPETAMAVEKNGETFFRFAGCNRAVQDVGDRPVYHIDMKDSK